MVLVYHGTNQPFPTLMKGTWITTDPNAAWDFAHEKVQEAGGVACVAEVSIDEACVDWDALSAFLEVEDERGTLRDQARQARWLYAF